VSATLEPFGFRPIRSLFGSGEVVTVTYPGGIASGYAANIGIGDPITALTDGTFQLAAAGAVISAVFAGWLCQDESVYNLGGNWVSGQTWTKAPLVKVIPVQDVIFAVQVSGALTSAARFDAADHVAGTPNTRSGMATSYLSSTLAGAAASAGWKIRGLHNIVGNDWTDAYPIVEVIANEPGLAFVPGNAI
jgi:hypothetical protein